MPKIESQALCTLDKYSTTELRILPGNLILNLGFHDIYIYIKMYVCIYIYVCIYSGMCMYIVYVCVAHARPDENV